MSFEEKVIAGVTKGTLEYTEDKIRAWITRHRNRELAFVEDPETINIAKAQRKRSEWNLFQQYVDDRDLRILFQMGLTLRRFEEDPKRIEFLRRKIFRKYSTKGLHVAQFVQNGFFGKLLGNVLERTPTPEELKKEIGTLFNDIERTVVFVQQADDVQRKTDMVVAKLQALAPKTLIICSSRSAMGKCEEIKKAVMRRVEGYTAELYKTNIKEIYFLNKQESLPNA